MRFGDVARKKNTTKYENNNNKQKQIKLKEHQTDVAVVSGQVAAHETRPDRDSVIEIDH